MADKVDTTNILRKLDFDSKERAVLTQLFDKELHSPMSLSKRTGIPRSSVYRILEELADRGIVVEVLKDRGKRFQICKPVQLNQLINKKRIELKSTRASVKKLQSLLVRKRSRIPGTQVRYYSGVSGMKQLVWNTLQADKEIVGYSIYGRSEIVGKSFIQRYNAEFKRRKLVDKVIINPALLKVVKKTVGNQHHQVMANVRLISDKDLYISGDTYIYNNIYSVNFWNEMEIIGVEIESPEIVKVQRGLFKLLWKKASKL